LKVSHAEYYRLKKKVQNSTNQRLNLIASKEFLSQHIERLDNLRTIESELFANYHLEKNPTKRANLLMHLAELQTYLSSYYDSTRYVMEQSAKNNYQRKKKKVSSN
jgi:hypothetical protein